MTDSPITARADFDAIRYAQLWEDADVLASAMGNVAGRTLVSVCSAGDNALALLTLDPSRVIAVDLSDAQLNCLRLRIGAIRSLEHGEFLELMGSRPSNRRGALLDRAIAELDDGTGAFWCARRDDVITHGAAGVGKFERYFRVFRRWLLPLVHSRRTIDAIFITRDETQRAAFFDRHFNTWRWRMLVRLFFSRPVMGRMGRDKAFFDYVEGSVARHVFSRLRHVGVDTDPADNPYLHWIMRGTHGAALPLAWRATHYDTIRERLDRLELHQRSLETLSVKDVAGFNLSDIFEYMSPETMTEVYRRLLAMAVPGARLIYWNMMAPRRRPKIMAKHVQRLLELENRLKATDKAFFYSDLVIEEIRR
ncbi:DUF3419 family protein [Arhodomonas sp. AD133]|uniref:DUF3419 family protein n=1 Tax=Arhodomonas sp. AD133 TaxID=3415009 RepID=UPI003EBEBBAD